jgi:hypothetical protein
MARQIEGGPRLRRDPWRCGSSLAACPLLTAVLATGPTAAQDARDKGGPVVSTAEGQVSGFVKNGVNIFLGIRYAAPPVGNLRWRPLAPVDKWQGTLDATAYANACPHVTELGVLSHSWRAPRACAVSGVHRSFRSFPTHRTYALVPRWTAPPSRLVSAQPMSLVGQ